MTQLTIKGHSQETKKSKSKSKSKRHHSIERYLGMEIPKCFLDEVCEATEIYKNCDRSTLERECSRMFAYIKVTEAYIKELELKLNIKD